MTYTEPLTHGFHTTYSEHYAGAIYMHVARDCGAKGGYLAALSRPTCLKCAAIWDRRNVRT